jgi:hypothetical protein
MDETMKGNDMRNVTELHLRVLEPGVPATGDHRGTRVLSKPTVEDDVLEEDAQTPREADGVLRHYRLYNDRQSVIFQGYLLASVSSERDGVQRWTEIEIFRTKGGRYIVNKVGVSVVVHLIDCPEVSTKKRHGIADLLPEETPPRDREPCPVCNPDVWGLLDTDPASLTFEQDRHRTDTYLDPQEMIEDLYIIKSGKRVLTTIVLSALDEASKSDPVVAATYNRTIYID